MMNTAVGLAALEGKRYLSLETYRKSGEGVRTPVCLQQNQRTLQLPTLGSSMSIQPQILARRSAYAVRVWSRSPHATRVGMCPANGSMRTPRSSAAKSSAAVWGLSTANTVRGSRSSIYLHYCFAVLNASCSRSGRSDRGRPSGKPLSASEACIKECSSNQRHIGLSVRSGTYLAAVNGGF